MAGMTIRIEGIERANANLKRLDTKIRRRVVTRAVRAGGKPIVKETKAQAPRRSGALQRSIKQSIRNDSRKGTVTARIRVKSTRSVRDKTGRNPDRYVHLVTEGAKPHKIRRAAIDGQYYHEIQHPGIRPNRFFERAGRVSSNRAISEFRKTYGAEVDKEVRGLPQ